MKLDVSRPVGVSCLAGALLLVALTSPALAQYNVPSQATGESLDIAIAYDPTPQKPKALGWELGASLDFLTSDSRIDGPGYKFTDIVFFRMHTLVAVGKRAELFGGVDLLPKQPSASDEATWQSAMIGARLGLSKRLSAYLRTQGGPALASDGWWLTGEAAGQAKVALADRFLFWESTIGATHTQLFPDANERRRMWQTELLAQTGIALRDKDGAFASWLSFGFHFPLLARPEPSRPDPVTGRSLDPTVRVGMALGILVGVNRGLDLFLEGQILDRGDKEDPRTTLPVLSGGSDQKRLVFGFNRRFGGRRR